MDGVILDSLNNLSSCLIRAVEPFCQSIQQLEKFSKFDNENPGLSRFEKTEFFINSLPNSSHIKIDKIKQQILDEFDSISLKARISSKIDNAIYSLNKKIPSQNLLLLSNCENTQLEVISAHFGFHRIFGGGIIGTPPNKKSRFTNLLKNNMLNSYISVSDSESDAIIARSLNLPFIFIQNYAKDQAPWLRENEYRFQTLNDLILNIKHINIRKNKIVIEPAINK